MAVLYVSSDPGLKDKTYDIDCVDEEGIFTVRVYYRISRIKIRIIYGLFKLARYLKGSYLGLGVIKKRFGRPDFIQVSGLIPAGFMALILKYLKGITYILNEEYTIYHPLNRKRVGIIREFLTHIVVRNARAFITVSDTLGKRMLNYGLKNKRFVIPNIVDTALFYPLSHKPVRQKKRMLSVAVLRPAKNISGIIYAIKKLSLKRQDFEFHIVGEGEDRQRLEEIADKVGIKNGFVFFRGMKFSEEVAQIMRESDFLIINSSYETFSIVAAEAIASGIPVITTRCGGPEEFVTEEKGIIVEPGNQKQLEDAIIYMLDNCDSYNKEHMHGYAKSNFSYEAVGKKFYEIYRQIYNNNNLQ